MEHLGVYEPYGLVFVIPSSHANIYAQRHRLLSHALAMGSSPADSAAVAGHSTKMLLDIYAKQTVRLLMSIWQAA